MSDNLSENKCEACSIDAQALTEQEISEFLPQIPSWIVHKEEGINRLICSFAFPNYEHSVNFAKLVAKLAEEEDHHPEIVLVWGNVTVSWWSHKIKGLHRNDFICASKTDELFKNL